MVAAGDQSIYDKLKEAIAAQRPAAVVTILRGANVGQKRLLIAKDAGTPGEDDETFGTLGDPSLDEQADRLAHEQLARERSGTHQVTDSDGQPVTLFVEAYPVPPLLLIFGAVHVGQALCRLAKQLGYRVIVSDARGALATEERFPEADRIIRAWPDEALAQVEVTPTTSIAILTHDPKFDEPAILGALKTPARYIGAVGSRKTNEDRRRRLGDAGATAEDVARIRGPIGLNIGAETPEEMAVAIMAEIIAVKYGRPGGMLTNATGRIRGEAVASAASD